MGTKKVKKVRPFCIMFPKMSAYRRVFEKTKYAFFDKMVSRKKNIMKFGEKSVRLFKRKFGSEPLYKDKYLKTKI